MKRNNVRRLLALVLVAALCLLCGAAAQPNATEIHIYSADDLVQLSKSCKLDTYSQGKTVYLDNDVDLSGSDFVPIPTFGGMFEGQGHTVSGLELSGDASHMGLFRYVQAVGTVRDLKITGNIDAAGTLNEIGAVVGTNYGTISGCSFNGTISGENNVGGIAGTNESSGMIYNCKTEGFVEGDHYVGGIVGQNIGTISYCSNTTGVNINASEAVDSAEDLDSLTLPTASDDEDDEPQDTIPQALGRGVFGMFKWLLLVVLFVLIIAGGGVAWLYRSATPDMLPEVKVTFDGQELAPTAYKWHVPVVGSFFKRTYAETLNSSPVVLEDAISDASPDIIVTPSDYSTQLTITDADKETVYEGSVTGFRSYLFAENGTFDAKLVVTASDSAAEDSSSVTGTETWQFRFTVGIKPSVTLCTPTVQQGSVAAVRVGSTMSQTEPTLTGPLESTDFVRAANGWICYLPIPWNAETGNTELTVTADGYTETLTLSVRAASYSYKDYSAKSQLTSPYIGADDAPDAVRRLLTTDGGEIQWAVGGFVQPFLDSFDTPLLYGMTEYVGRSYSERSTNYGYGGRTSTNVVIKPKKSKDSMIVPASGHVLLAEDLGGSYGYTVVIDHGAGLRSIFYGLTALDVEAGDDVKQGQLLGTSGRTVVAELRIGTVPINPLLVWRGQCDGLKYY